MRRPPLAVAWALTAVAALLSSMAASSLVDGADFSDVGFHAYRVPAKETNYVCRHIALDQLRAEAPASSASVAIAEHKRYITRFEPIIEHQDMLHHILMFACPRSAALETGGPVYDCIASMQDSCHQFLFAWALGQGPFDLPAEADFEVGGPDEDDINAIILEYHYHNPRLLSDVVDSSRVRVWHSSSARCFRAGYTIMIPDGMDPGTRSDELEIPANVHNFRLGTVCRVPAGVEASIVAVFFHMHLIGRRIWSQFELQRGQEDGGHARRVADDEYDFNRQRLLTIDPPVLVRAGDNITTWCEYDNVGGAPRKIGPSTSEELCNALYLYYPRTDDWVECYDDFNLPSTSEPLPTTTTGPGDGGQKTGDGASQSLPVLALVAAGGALFALLLVYVCRALRASAQAARRDQARLAAMQLDANNGVSSSTVDDNDDDGRGRAAGSYVAVGRESTRGGSLKAPPAAVGLFQLQQQQPNRQEE